MFTFNNSEERWFCSWVVMRRKFLNSQIKVKSQSKIIQKLRNIENDLRHEISDLKRNRNLKNEIEESKNRQKMIDEFNQKNNKGRRYKKKIRNK